MIKRLKPFLLSFFIIAADQVTKALVDAFIPLNSIKWRLFGDFLWIVHVRNDAVAFSMGSGLQMPLKIILFIALPILLVSYISYYIIKDDISLSLFQKYALAGFAGGGIGNLIDRIFRGMSVVDFISMKTYGIFGMERFPTYNIADASVVVSAILLLISMFSARREVKEAMRKKENKEFK